LWNVKEERKGGGNFGKPGRGKLIKEEKIGFACPILEGENELGRRDETRCCGGITITSQVRKRVSALWKISDSPGQRRSRQKRDAERKKVVLRERRLTSRTKGPTNFRRGLKNKKDFGGKEGQLTFNREREGAMPVPKKRRATKGKTLKGGGPRERGGEALGKARANLGQRVLQLGKARKRGNGFQTRRAEHIEDRSQ